ncbi:MAG: endonuclease/exonuclease/phosphatase family protein [bacterium]|nr:endonuclease/exonuclease/phosphatase family protein [bacterium]
MKLIQLNLWQGKLVNQIEDLLNEERPDILCLQEVIDVPKGDGVIFYTVEEIRKQFKTPIIFLSPVFTFHYMNRVANFCNGIITNYPIVRSETIFTHESFVEKLDLAERETNMRNFQHATIDLPGKKLLHVLNHHGYRVAEHKNGDEKSLEQCQMIADYASSLDGPVILTGDFNLVPDSASIEKINEVLTNLTLKAKLKTTRTSLTRKTEACDYIFVSKDIKVKSFKASDAVVSDHQALILEFDI